MSCGDGSSILRRIKLLPLPESIKKFVALEDVLMELAQTKYRTLVEVGKWKAQTPDQKKIIALTAKIEDLQKSKTYHPSKLNKDDSNQKAKSNKNGSDNNENKKKRVPWYFVKPKDGETTKKHKDKTYYWCKNHGRDGKWVMHKPSECKGRDYRPPNNGGGNNNQPNLQVTSMVADLSARDADDF